MIEQTGGARAMCKAKPNPRCHSHALEELERHHRLHPGLARLTLAQVMQAHAQAVSANKYSQARILSREMDLRLDVDATSEGLKALREAVRARPEDTDAWYRLNVAQATYDAKVRYAQAHQPLPPRDDDARTLVERRERLARLEGRMAGLLVTRGHLGQAQVSALCREYEATLQAEAVVRLRAAGGEPDLEHATARDLRSWRSAMEGARDGLGGMAEQAEQFAARSHRARALAEWGYAHMPGDEPYPGRRALTGSALDAVHVAALTRAPVRWDAGTITVEAPDPAHARAQLWHAGFPVATPSGPVVVRTGQLAAA